MVINISGIEAPSIYRAVASSSLSCPFAEDGRLHQSLDLQEARDQAQNWSRESTTGPWCLEGPQMSFFICESRTQISRCLDLMEQNFDLSRSRLSVEVFVYVSLYDPVLQVYTSGILQSDSRIYAEGDEVPGRLTFLRRLCRPTHEDHLGTENIKYLGFGRWINSYMQQRFHPSQLGDYEIGLLRFSIQSMDFDEEYQPPGAGREDMMDEGYESAEAGEHYV